ncbi:MAG: FAD:protein FMN transferase [Rhodospirillales bacterium]|nr:FAD:protein FMN transferase [Rhodospirillales bacterium]
MDATRFLMGMPITVDVPAGTQAVIEAAFARFADIEARFSPYRPDSEVVRFNALRLADGEPSEELREVLALAERTRIETRGYFDIARPDGFLDPTGIVKGWAIRDVAHLIEAQGFTDYLVDAGGDIQCRGSAPDGEPWRIGIRNPFDAMQIVKIVAPRDRGIATSGTSARGQHIYDPHRPGREISDVRSITVIGPDVLEADRFATAAFAMGESGIDFIEAQPGLEGYLIGADRVAVQTTGFREFVVS